MLFNSPVFIFAFLPATLLCYFALGSAGRPRAAQGCLVGASLLFYGWWRVEYVPLLLGSVGVNYLIGGHLQRGSAPGWLRLGIVFNLGLLGVFKYADFAVANVNTLTGSALPALQIALPLAISFFTFQQIAYLVDCQRRRVEGHDLLHYALFVTFFPQLIAGPIVHHSETIPQFRDARRERWDGNNLALGAFVFAIGLFKKVVIADTFAIWANQGFGHPESLGLVQAWGASLSYTFQLYFDFSGYTDMAIGGGWMFNVRLPLNFDSPYKATSPRDFWRRWHMTLSRFLRDYLYIPLGGNRHGALRAQTNLLIVMLLGGLWHGAAWTFVVWGGLHGVALVAHRGWRSAGMRMPTSLAWPSTFLFVTATWVFFRATSLSEAGAILRSMCGLNGSGFDSFLLTAGDPPAWFAVDGAMGATVATWFWIAVFGAVAFLLPNSNQLTAADSAAVKTPGLSSLRFRVGARSGVLAGVLAAVAVARLLLVEGTEFLYFNF